MANHRWCPVPASQRSLQLTDAYRARLLAARDRIERYTDQRWRALMPADLDGQTWVEGVAVVLTAAQREAVRATAGYLNAYLASELGQRGRLVLIDSRRYAGFSRDGRPLRESLQSPIFGAKAALKDGRGLVEALQAGLARALRAVALDTDQAARFALLDAIEADDRLTGWRRAVSGTCGACLGASEDERHFAIHPGCQCIPEPVVRDAPDRFPRLTGLALFESMTPEHQDEALGPDTAELVRSGEVPLHRLVKRDRLETEPDFISQRPLEAL